MLVILQSKFTLSAFTSFLFLSVLLLLLLSRFSRVQLCATPETAAHQAPLSLGFSRQEHWIGFPFPSPMHESEKWKWSRSVVSDPQQPHGLQPTRLLRPWDFPGKSTGVGCYCLLRFLSIVVINLSLWRMMLDLYTFLIYQLLQKLEYIFQEYNYFLRMFPRMFQILTPSTTRLVTN